MAIKLSKKFILFYFLFRKNKSLQIAKLKKLKNSKTWTKTTTQTDKTGQHISAQTSARHK